MQGILSSCPVDKQEERSSAVCGALIYSRINRREKKRDKDETEA
jgi:hypothetical protein